MDISIIVRMADYRGDHSEEIDVPINCDIDKPLREIVKLIYENYDERSVDFIKIRKIVELKEKKENEVNF